jgi:hypothetical protein
MDANLTHLVNGTKDSKATDYFPGFGWSSDDLIGWMGWGRVGDVLLWVVSELLLSFLDFS